MGFMRAMWRVMVGVKDALALIFLLLLFWGIYALLSVSPRPIGEGVLALNLGGTIVEQPSEPSTIELLSGSADTVPEHRLRDLVAAVDHAASDDRVKAISLDLDGFLGGGQVALGDLGAALDRAKKAGKPVLAYATAYTDDGYQLAAHASEVWLNPMGGVLLRGPGGSSLFYKGLLEKLGVTPNVFRVGTYKAAVEPYLRDDFSPEARENEQALVGALHEQWLDEVRAARPKAKAAAFAANPVAALDAAGGDLGKAALAAGLVDKLAERREFDKRLAELGGENDGVRPYRSIRMRDYIADTVDDGDGPIGVVTVAGTIVDGDAGPGTAAGSRIAREIDRAVAEGDLKALVVRVDSPGGSTLASEQIRQSILGAKAKGMPVVVSMGNMAASGGYWVATAADHVLAEPSTITGSIGVFAVIPSFQGTLQKLGVGVDGLKTTPLSGEPNLLTGPSDDSKRIFQAGVDGAYRKFLTLVAASRKKTPEQIDRVAQGRVWDGGTARQIGLVDGFGGLDDAIAKARSLAKLDADAGVQYLDRPDRFGSLLEAFATSDEDEEGSAPTDAVAVIAAEQRVLLANAIGDMRQMLSAPSIQARCLICGPVAVSPPRAATATPDWLQLLVALFD